MEDKQLFSNVQMHKECDPEGLREYSERINSGMGPKSIFGGVHDFYFG